MSCEPPRRRAGRTRPASTDAGVSLTESSIALMLMALIVAWVASSIGSTGRAIGEAHSQEQATQLALEGIEFTRSLTWDQLRLDPAAAAGDPRVDAENRTLIGALFGLATNEPLVEGGEGAVVPPAYEETLDATAFTIRTYVTDAGDGLRRVIVEVAWTIADSPRRHFATTMISELSAG